MQLGMIGLGRMGAQHRAPADARTATTASSTTATRTPVAALAGEGATAAATSPTSCAKLDKPARRLGDAAGGRVTEDTIDAAGAACSTPGDIIIDGGNSFYKDDIRRAEALTAKGIHYVDVGTSGGVWGLERGYCMMIGGDKDAVEHLDPIFAALAPGPGDDRRARRAARAAIRAPSRATSTAARAAPATSSR